MEQTAVEWFADRIKHGGLVSKKQFDELLEQANEKFEKQIIMALEYGAGIEIFHENDGEQYYNETFKKKSDGNKNFRYSLLSAKRCE